MILFQTIDDIDYRFSIIMESLDCYDLYERLDQIPHGVAVVLCERSEDIAALHSVLKGGKDRLITNDPGSHNKEFHHNDLGKRGNY